MCKGVSIIKRKQLSNMAPIIFIFICLALVTLANSISIPPVVARANNGHGKRSRRDAKQIEEARKEREQCDAMRTSLEGISCATPGLLSKETHGMCVAYEKRCTINSSLHAIQIIFLLVTTAFSMVLFRPPTLFGETIPFGTEA